MGVSLLFDISGTASSLLCFPTALARLVCPELTGIGCLLLELWTPPEDLSRRYALIVRTLSVMRAKPQELTGDEPNA